MHFGDRQTDRQTNGRTDASMLCRLINSCAIIAAFHGMLSCAS